jgi:Skp family chaperone for outer membrane proteins
MQPMTSRILWLAAGVTIASMVLTPVVIIARPAVPTQPTVVATVNLEVIFNNLPQKKAADDELTAFAGELQQQQDKTRAEIDRLAEELGGLAPGTAAYQDKSRQWHRKSFEFQAQIEHNRLKLDNRKGMTLRNLYLAIKAEAKALSDEQGIDIVMLDDAVVDVELGSEADVSRQISARRTLHCNPEIDVTQELIERLKRSP